MAGQLTDLDKIENANGAGGGGAGADVGLWGRLNAWLRGRGAQPERIRISGVDDRMIQDAAAATEGFSGRELAKLVASMQVCMGRKFLQRGLVLETWQQKEDWRACMSCQLCCLAAFTFIWSCAVASAAENNMRRQHLVPLQF